MNTEKHKILVVDDESGFLELMKELLEEEGYDVLTAESGERGIEVLKKKNSISVVISDQKMSGISGVELLEAVKNSDPRIIRILISGSIDEYQLMKLASSGDLFWYASKPIDLMEVLDKIKIGIEQYEKNRG